VSPVSAPSTPAGDPDAALVQALRTEDPEAAEALVNAHGDRLYQLAVRITGSSEDAADVVQRALETATRKIHMLANDSTLGGWLYCMTANAAYQRLRAGTDRQHDIARENIVPAADGAGPHVEPADDWSARADERAIQDELREIMQGALGELPPDYRTAFVMHDMEGRSNPEVAEALGISLPGVTARVHRSRLLLRQRLTQHMSAASKPPRR